MILLKVLAAYLPQIMYKILEVNILCNHPHDGYIVSVLIESVPGYCKAYFLVVSELSDKMLQRVCAYGEKLRENRAHDLFESYRGLKAQKRLVYEG
jgi:hypothetical protein